MIDKKCCATCEYLGIYTTLGKRNLGYIPICSVDGHQKKTDDICDWYAKKRHSGDGCVIYKDGDVK